MPEHKTSPSGEIELFATAPPPSTKPKKKKKRKKFADWYDNEIAAVLDDEEPNNRSQTDGSCCEYNDDDDSSSSDYSEGLALLQSSLDTLEIDEETNHRHMFSCCGFWWHRMWNYHWLGPGNEKWTMGGITLLDAPSAKLVRFLLVTVLSLGIVHGYALAVGDKRDETLGLRNLIVYDGGSIVTDTIVFFGVGRLYLAPAVDRLSFFVPMLVVAILQSWGATHLQNLQHSITPYELKCEWTWPMYLLVVGGCLPVLAGLVGGHLVVASRNKKLTQTLIEWILSGLLFLGPYRLFSSTKSFFHLHHWYYAWFLGMHCNLHDKWWSRLAMSVLWGIYVNGVAIFGRDPVMTCAVSLYRSQSQECPYLGDHYAYDEYTLDDLGKDLGILHDTIGNGDTAIVCASDITRWFR